MMMVLSPVERKLQQLYGIGMVSYIKGRIQAKDIWKQDPEANIWAQGQWECGVEKAP